MFYPEGFANFALEKSFVPIVTFFFVYEHGKLGISVNTSPIMALVVQDHIQTFISHILLNNMYVVFILLQTIFL